MSRVGRLPIAIPAGVTVDVTPDNVVTVKGPKGQLVKAMHKDINIAIEDNAIVVTRPSDVKEHRALHGLTRALVNNMVVGVTEVNGDYIKEKGMKIVRRLTGGGAVFNDLGNINFTFIGRTSENVEENFRKFTKPIIEALNFLGVQAEFSGKNDLVIEGKKNFR